MTKTFEELEAKVDKLATRYSHLETMLLGEVAGAGMLARLNDAIDKTSSAFALVEKYVVEDRAEIRAIKAFLAPVLEGTKPPLDGAQIATKAFVDEGLERLARALREEISQLRAKARPAIEFVTTLAEHLHDLRGFSGSLAIEIGQLWARDMVRMEAEAREVARPSRLQSLIHAVTGRSNGAPR